MLRKVYKLNLYIGSSQMHCINELNLGLDLQEWHILHITWDCWAGAEADAYGGRGEGGEEEEHRGEGGGGGEGEEHHCYCSGRKWSDFVPTCSIYSLLTLVHVNSAIVIWMEFLMKYFETRFT